MEQNPQPSWRTIMIRHCHYLHHDIMIHHTRKVVGVDNLSSRGDAFAWSTTNSTRVFWCVVLLSDFRHVFRETNWNHKVPIFRVGHVVLARQTAFRAISSCKLKKNKKIVYQKDDSLRKQTGFYSLHCPSRCRNTLTVSRPSHTFLPMQVHIAERASKVYFHQNFDERHRHWHISLQETRWVPPRVVEEM